MEQALRFPPTPTNADCTSARTCLIQVMRAFHHNNRHTWPSQAEYEAARTQRHQRTGGCSDGRSKVSRRRPDDDSDPNSNSNNTNPPTRAPGNSSTTRPRPDNTTPARSTRQRKHRVGIECSSSSDGEYIYNTQSGYRQDDSDSDYDVAPLSVSFAATTISNTPNQGPLTTTATPAGAAISIAPPPPHYPPVTPADTAIPIAPSPSPYPHLQHR